MRLITRLPLLQSEFGFQTTSLFLLDGLANVIDFAFHFWMARVLIPSDFAILQTLNSVVLVYVTASGVFQPVISRFVAEARGVEREDSIPAIFQSFLRASLWLGLGVSLIVLVFSSRIAQLLNLPAWTIQISAALIFISTLRPVAIGMLQGQERFLPLGSSRLIAALGRLMFAVVFIHYGLALRGAVIAFPLGWLVGIISAFLFLGSSMWVKQEPTSTNILREGWKLSVYALLAYIAFTSLTSIDLVWVNRNLPGETAGAYASLVLFRRIVALLPGVAVVVMFPRIAKTLAEGKSPDRLLIHTAVIVIATSGLLTSLYFIFRPTTDFYHSERRISFGILPFGLDGDFNDRRFAQFDMVEFLSRAQTAPLRDSVGARRYVGMAVAESLNALHAKCGHRVRRDGLAFIRGRFGAISFCKEGIAAAGECRLAMTFIHHA